MKIKGGLLTRIENVTILPLPTEQGFCSWDNIANAVKKLKYSFKTYSFIFLCSK